MKQELHTFLYTCEGCGEKHYHSTIDKYSTPDGWGKKEIHGCGMTGYTKTIDVCPKCNEKKVVQDATSWRLE